MIKKLGNRNLLLILIAVVSIFGIMKYRSNKIGENTFKTGIIPIIDSAKLNRIVIFPKMKAGKPFTLEKKGSTWYVTRENVTNLTDQHSVNALIEMVKQINPDRLASNDPKDFKDLNVNDSLGLRVVFFGGNDTMVDLIVGRFSYVPNPKTQMNFGRNNGTAYSAVRLNHQNNVYKVEGFLTLNVSDEYNQWRDKKIMPQEPPKDWNKLTFTYPADSGFVLSKDSLHGWKFVDGSKPDSATAENLIKGISERNYGSFIDKFDSTNKQPIFSLKIEGKDFSPVIIKAYPADTAYNYAISSTLLPGSFFSGKNDNEVGKIFLTKVEFNKKAGDKSRPKPLKGL